jgi:hypothetical protein
MVTSHHPEMAAGVRKFTLFHVLDPGAEHTQRNLVLLFARHGTGVTANTSVLIDNKAVTHDELENDAFVAEKGLPLFAPRSNGMMTDHIKGSSGERTTPCR